MAPLWLDVLDETIRACVAYRRADLAHQLQRKRGQLLDPRLRVLVAGLPGQGKSQLVNALIAADVCGVGDDVSTAIPTVVGHADTPHAVLVTSPLAAADRAIASGTATDRTPVPVAELARRTGRAVAGGHRGEFVHAEVGIPRALLAPGLVLIDTPAIGAADPVRAAATEAALGVADVVLMVSDATQQLTGTELDFLAYAAGCCPYLLIALTKTDLCPHWRQVAEQNRTRLVGAGVAARLIPVSSALRRRATDAGDHTLNAESGFPELIGCLCRDVSSKAERLSPRAAAVLADTVLAELAAPLREEHAEPLPDTGRDAPGELREVQRRFDELRRHATRWQNTLADEVADLVSDLEYDLRERTRTILRGVDEFFDAADPVQVWDEFTGWLRDNLLDAAEANFGWLVARSHWIARRIAADFPAHREGVLPEAVFWVPEEVFTPAAALERPAVGQFGLGQKVFTGLRGSYGGLVMFGLITSLAGLPLINAVSLGAGAVFGGKSLHDESENRLLRRQAAAKAAVQRHVEDFFLRFSKDCKDVARQVHRRLRDHFAALAEDLQESLVSSARLAKEAADTDAVRRDRRREEIRRELDRLSTLHGQVRALAGVRGVPDPVGITA